jgi:hypothetical protein
METKLLNVKEKSRVNDFRRKMSEYEAMSVRGGGCRLSGSGHFAWMFRCCDLGVTMPGEREQN